MLKTKESSMSQDRFDDPIVAEIHRTREKLLQECEGDMEKLMDRLVSREETDRTRVLLDLQPTSLSPRRP
jgi:hypothetical protein